MHGMNLPPPTFQPQRITDPPLLPPPPPRRAYSDIPPYGLLPEMGFRDFSGPYTTNIEDSTNEDAHPRRDRHPLERRALESRWPTRPPNNDLQRQKVTKYEILAQRAHIEELTQNLALEKTRSRSRRPRMIQVIDLDDTLHGSSKTSAAREDPIILLPLGDLGDPTPSFIEKIMNANISRRLKMPTIKTCEVIDDSANHI